MLNYETLNYLQLYIYEVEHACSNMREFIPRNVLTIINRTLNFRREGHKVGVDWPSAHPHGSDQASAMFLK